MDTFLPTRSGNSSASENETFFRIDYLFHGLAGYACNARHVRSIESFPPSTAARFPLYEIASRSLGRPLGVFFGFADRQRPDRRSSSQRPAAIRLADKSGDAKLTLAEYLPLDVQAKHHGEEHFKAGDANHDGFLNVTELAATLTKQTWFVILTEGIDPCFARLDADKNNRLDPAEYRGISRMGHHADQHFKGADTDHNGFLDLKEFGAHAEAKLGKTGQKKATADGPAQ